MKKPYDGGVRAAPLEGDLRMEGAEKGKADIDTIQQLVEKGGIDLNQLYEIAKLLNKTNFNLTMEVLAIEDGFIGDRIRVRNQESGEIIYATVKDVGLVELQ